MLPPAVFLLYIQGMRRSFLFPGLLFVLPPLIPAQEALRAESASSFQTISAGPETDILEACPKFQNFKQEAAYPDDTSGLKDVSEVSTDALPLPADDMDRAGLLAALKHTLTYWRAKPDSFKVLVGKDHYTAPQIRLTTRNSWTCFRPTWPRRSFSPLSKRSSGLTARWRTTVPIRS